MSRARFAPKRSCFVCRLAASLLFIAFSLTLYIPSVVQASEEVQPGKVPIKVVAILGKNDLGKPLQFPRHVMFDSSMDETYVLSGDRIVVFGADFYPFIALGKGRGAVAPQGLTVDRNGMLYLCQGRSTDKAARLTIFNAAFFPVRDIFFKGFVGAETFSPQRAAISQDGIIYVAGSKTPGVLVMDQQGEVLRWLKPQERFRSEAAIAEKKAAAAVAKEDFGSVDLGENEQLEEVDDAESAPVDQYLALPDALMPRQKGMEEKEKIEGVRPVTIVDIEIDQEGHLYLLSEDASKIYVYSANEELLFSFGMKGGSSGKMSRPRALAVDEKKKCIYVVDYMRQTILIYDLAGKFMQEFGGAGWGPGWFSYPTDVALNRKGHVIICDLYNQRVQVLDVQFQSRFPLFGSQSQDKEEKEKPTPEVASERSQKLGDDKNKPGEGEMPPVVKPEPLAMPMGSGADGEGRQEEPPTPWEDVLPEPISPPSAGEEESLSATGEASSGIAPPSSSVENPAAAITEEPIGAIPDDWR